MSSSTSRRATGPDPNPNPSLEPDPKQARDWRGLHASDELSATMARGEAFYDALGGTWHRDAAAAHASHLQVRVLRAELPPVLEADLSVSVSCPMPSDRESDDGDDIDTVLSASQLFERATFALLGCTGGRESRAG